MSKPPSSVSIRADELRKKLGLTYDHLIGIRFAINVAISTAIVWYTLQLIGDKNPIWAIASMVAASDPQPLEAKRMFKARLSNVLVALFCSTRTLKLSWTGSTQAPVNALCLQGICVKN